MSRPSKPAASPNPFGYLPQGEIAELFNLGIDAVAALVALGAPTVAKKINPDHFKRWLWENREKIGKLT